jgi:hypothetical protein
MLSRAADKDSDESMSSGMYACITPSPLTPTYKWNPLRVREKSCPFEIGSQFCA